MRSARGVAPLVLWLTLLSVMLHWLHRSEAVLGPPESIGTGEWIAIRGPEVAVIVVLRFACLALGWYLLVATCAAVVVRWMQIRRAALVVESLTPPLVRHLVRGIAGVAMTATATTVATASPALSQASALTARSVPASAGGGPTGPITSAPADEPADEPTMRRILDGSDEERSSETPTGDPPVEMRMLPPKVETGSAPTGVKKRTIVAGDHFWSIAESELVAARALPVTDAEIDPYWRLLVEANRAEVVDPDLLFPGQVVVVPPLPPGTGGT